MREGNIVSDLPWAGCLVFELANVYRKTCVFVSGDVYTLKAIVRVRLENLSSRAVLRKTRPLTSRWWAEVTHGQWQRSREDPNRYPWFSYANIAPTRHSSKFKTSLGGSICLTSVSQDAPFLLKRRYISRFFSSQSINNLKSLCEIVAFNVMTDYIPENAHSCFTSIILEKSHLFNYI